MLQLPQKTDTRTTFLVPLSDAVLSPQNFVKRFTNTCGRFLTPFSFVDRVELVAARMLTKMRVWRGVFVCSLEPLPPSWQVLLNYLWVKKIISRPEFFLTAWANDLPKHHAVQLHAAMFDAEKTDGTDVSQRTYGYGISSVPEEAYSKAVGEMLERYFLTLYKTDTFLWSSYINLQKKGIRALDPETLNNFLPWQTQRFKNFSTGPSESFFWVKGKDLVSGKKTFIPAQLIFRNYAFDLVRERMLQPITSNGGAGHFSFEEAVIAALCELVERDSFYIFWLNSIAPPVIDVSSCADASVQRLLTSFKCYDISLYFLDTTTDLEIPSCVCVLVDRRAEEPVLALGASAGFDGIKNIISSVYEALSVLNTLGKKPSIFLPDDYEAFSGEPDVDRHARLSLWIGEKMFKNFSFFLSGKRVSIGESRFGTHTKTFGTKKEEYNFLLELFKNKGTGYEVYCYEVSHRVLKKVGFFVVKVVVPKLFPLYLFEHTVTLQSERLHDVPAKLGYKETTLNPFPHPFP